MKYKHHQAPKFTNRRCCFTFSGLSCVSSCAIPSLETMSFRDLFEGPREGCPRKSVGPLKTKHTATGDAQQKLKIMCDLKSS